MLWGYVIVNLRIRAPLLKIEQIFNYKDMIEQIMNKYTDSPAAPAKQRR